MEGVIEALLPAIAALVAAWSMFGLAIDPYSSDQPHSFADPHCVLDLKHG